VLFALPFLAIFALFVAIVRRLTAIPSRVHDPTVKKPARADGPSGAHPVLKEKAQPVCRRVGGPGDGGKCDEYQNTDCLEVSVSVDALRLCYVCDYRAGHNLEHDHHFGYILLWNHFRHDG